MLVHFFVKIPRFRAMIQHVMISMIQFILQEKMDVLTSNSNSM